VVIDVRRPPALPSSSRATHVPASKRYGTRASPQFSARTPLTPKNTHEMTTQQNPYDELPYVSSPIEWTAPERMAAVSLLQGGPVPELVGLRYLELGSGDATNLIPLARYRPESEFIGIDGSARLVDAAVAERDANSLSNLSLRNGSFDETLGKMTGPFDYVVLHGVFSWVDDRTRDLLLAFAARALAPAGLLYVSYNALPGWNVRGLVRDYLLSYTRGAATLRERVTAAKGAATRIAKTLLSSPHPYSQLLGGEFALARDGGDSYIAHEYLAETNRAYWQSEIASLGEAHGLSVVGDADLGYANAAAPPGVREWVAAEKLEARGMGDTVDLLCYAQFRCALLCRREAPRAPFDVAALAKVRVASDMVPHEVNGETSLKTRGGLDVNFDDPVMKRRFMDITGKSSVPALDVVSAAPQSVDDLLVLHRNGAVELRLWESSVPLCPLLSERERAARGEYTSPVHRRVRV
jgi:SAM-dependent methyltransferase